MGIKKQIVTVFSICCLSLFFFAAQGEAAYSPAELKRMSTFLSNFTELGFMTFTVEELASADPQWDLIRFGLRHNYLNNRKSRIQDVNRLDHTIDGKYVAESVKKYFDLDVKLVTVDVPGYPSYDYDGKLYKFSSSWMSGPYGYARVSEAHKAPSGAIRMSGVVHSAGAKAEPLGSFTALAKPHKHNGKDTWAIINMKTELYTGQADPDFRFVVIDGYLGGMQNGQWVGGGWLFLNGNPIRYTDIEEKDVENYNDNGIFEMQRVKWGQNIAYFSPEGKVGEGTVDDAYLTYCEAAGVESDLSFGGYQPKYQTLVIGVAEGINAVPAPTVRKQDDASDELSFSCEYKGVEYAVVLTRRLNPKGRSEGYLVTAALSVGNRSWDIKPTDEERFSLGGWSDEDSPECGFFDLDGDGKLELAINLPGANGNMLLFSLEAKSGPKLLVDVYTGGE